MSELRLAIITCLVMLFWVWVILIALVITEKLPVVLAGIFATMLAPFSVMTVLRAGRDW